MDKKKLALVIIGTLLAMALVATALVLWLVPKGNGGNGADASTPTDSVVTDGQNGEEGDGTEPYVNEPTVGVDVEIPGETGGNSGSGNGGNSGSGNGGNSGNEGGNNEIDFDDLLGAG